MEKIDFELLKNTADEMKRENPQMFKIAVSDEDSMTPEYLSEIEKPEDIYDYSFCYPGMEDVNDIFYSICKKLGINFSDISEDVNMRTKSYLYDIIEVKENDAWKNKKKYRVLIYPWQMKNLNTLGTYIGDSMSYLGRIMHYNEEYDDSIIPSDSPVRKLLFLQGYEIKDLFKNTDSAFLRDFKETLETLWRQEIDTVFMAIPLKVSFNDYFKLKSGEFSVGLNENTPVLFYNPLSGSGADDIVSTEKPMLIDVSKTDDPIQKSREIPDMLISMDGTGIFGFSVDDIYGFSDGFWENDYSLSNGKNSSAVVWL